MGANVVIWFIGMVVFACFDAAIVLYANSAIQPFSLIWWCLALLGGLSMCASFYCRNAFISTTKKRQCKYRIKHTATAFVGNIILMIVLAKGV